MQRECKICGQIFNTRPQNENTRKYCSYKCSRTAENNVVKERRRAFREVKPRIIKNCVGCGISFTPLKNAFSKHCTEQCQNKHYKKTHRDKVLLWKKAYRLKHPDRVSKQRYEARSKSYFGGNRRAVNERDNFQCVKCFKGYPLITLVIHHKDENKKNNTMENLETLCQSCHAKSHSNLNHS